MRCAKLLLLGGPVAQSQTDRLLGLPLELVAERNPYLLKAGGILPVRILYKNQPPAGVLVMALNQRHPTARVAARSDKAGRVQLRLSQPGPWLIKAVHMIPATGAADRQWDSFWASLTCEVPEARAARPPRRCSNASGPWSMVLSGPRPNGANVFRWEYGWTFASYALQVQTRAGDEPSTQWLEGGEMSAPVSLDVVASDVAAALGWPVRRPGLHPHSFQRARTGGLRARRLSAEPLTPIDPCFAPRPGSLAGRTPLGRSGRRANASQHRGSVQCSVPGYDSTGEITLRGPPTDVRALTSSWPPVSSSIRLPPSARARERARLNCLRTASRRASESSSGYRRGEPVLTVRMLLHAAAAGHVMPGRLIRLPVYGTYAPRGGARRLAAAA